MPLSFTLGLLLLGLILLWFTRRQTAGKVAVTIGVLLLAVSSYSPIPSIMTQRLEHAYQPLQSINHMGLKWVVVLGGGHTSDPGLPINSRLGGATTMRLVEGIRLYRSIPRSKLILSGSGVFDPVSNAETMAGTAEAIGVNRQDIVLEKQSRDTGEQARLIKEMVGDDAFILVTSASHMPRSMALFKKQGMDPVPAPTDYLVKERQGMHPGMFFPGAGNLQKLEAAWHEYLGMAWGKLRGRI